ncbi:MAG: RHS repeat-associated core domain-containing protein [Xanthomonadales bacterium]|nr:RHS repeat-associated core domain-containing protein [Xanthomonadales bacterium]
MAAKCRKHRGFLPAGATTHVQRTCSHERADLRPHLGRFLQADPFVEDSTTLNRYTYVHNNPLSLTDPSGFFSFGKLFKLAAVVAISVYTGGLAAGQFAFFGSTLAGGQAFAAAVVGGALAGGIATGSVEGALWGAFSGAVFFGIGQGFDQLAGAKGTGVFGTGLRKSQFALQSVSHGLAGGTIAEMQGGKFGHGFLSAGISKAATPGVAANVEGTFQQGFVLAIVGGTTSEISGGKFANGAVTAAMSFSFGQLAQRGSNGSGRSDLLSLSDEELDALIESRTDFGFDPATAIAFQPPSLPQGFVNFAAGLGDGLLFGFGDELRGALNIDGGVNRDSSAYFAGEVTSYTAGGARIAYAGAAKVGARLAPSGAAASAFRNRLKVIFRFGLFRNVRTGTYVAPSDALLRAQAGRTDRYLNAYGAGIVGGGAFGD